MNKNKIKKALKLCRDGKCNECLYNGWVKEVCQKVLMDDTIKLINQLDKAQEPTLEQITFDI